MDSRNAFQDSTKNIKLYECHIIYCKRTIKGSNLKSCKERQHSASLDLGIIIVYLFHKVTAPLHWEGDSTLTASSDKLSRRIWGYRLKRLYARFEVLTAMKIQVVFVWVVTHLQRRAPILSTGTFPYVILHWFCYHSLDIQIYYPRCNATDSQLTTLHVSLHIHCV